MQCDMISEIIQLLMQLQNNDPIVSQTESIIQPDTVVKQVNILAFFSPSFVFIWRVVLSVISVFHCSRPVLFSHPETNPPKGWRCSVLLRKQRNSSYLRNYGPVIPGMPCFKCCFSFFCVLWWCVCVVSHSLPFPQSLHMLLNFTLIISLFFFSLF